MEPGSDSFKTLTTLEVDGQEYHYFSLEKLAVGESGRDSSATFFAKDITGECSAF